jgi:2',3'-cyclic-nucleotide 2'-phosphodiesterase
MNVLMVGDVVGPGAVAYLEGRLPELRREHDVDLVMVNAENCAVSAATPWEGGLRYDRRAGRALLASGVDVITSGNHGWDGPEAEIVHRHPRVLRPHNRPDGVIGKGFVTLDVGGERVSVLNLGSKTAVTPEALPVYGSFVTAELGGTIVVDFHGDSAWEKMEPHPPLRCGRAARSRIAASHRHVRRGRRLRG